MRSFVFVVALAVCACNAQSKSELAVLKAVNYGAKFDVIIRVIDDGGVPIEGVKCEGWAYINNHKDNGYPHSAVTDSNGVVRISGKCGRWVSVFLTKDGYYMTNDEIRFKDVEPSLLGDGRWNPYGETLTMVLKKIKQPVRLVHYAPSHAMKAEVSREWHGYDLELRDWMPPYGKGQYADMLVRLDVEAHASSDFKATMEVSFTNNPHAGAYQLTKDRHSEMKSVYTADTNAVYKTHFQFLHERHPVIHKKPIVYSEGVSVTDTRLDKDSYLVFRTRTRVDGKGNLLSAHYGKIYGLWEIYRAMHAHEVYFNPTPNDTNLEDLETAERSRMLQRQREESSSQKKSKSLWPF